MFDLVIGVIGIVAGMVALNAGHPCATAVGFVLCFAGGWSVGNYISKRWLGL